MPTARIVNSSCYNGEASTKPGQLQKHKVKLAFGADYPLTRHPRYGLYSASIAEAIRLYTAAPALLTWEEEQKGALEPGKLADLIVLDRDPYTIAPVALLDMQVDLTKIGGRIVRDRLRDDPSKYEPAPSGRQPSRVP